MPFWFFILLLVVLAVALILAIAMGVSRRSASGRQTTIIERD
jgi:hypothetical protein